MDFTLSVNESGKKCAIKKTEIQNTNYYKSKWMQIIAHVYGHVKAEKKLNEMKKRFSFNSFFLQFFFFISNLF